MALEELEKELYRRDFDISEKRRAKRSSTSGRPAGHAGEQASKPPETWGEKSENERGVIEGAFEEAFEKTTSVGRRLFFVIIGVSVLVIAVSGFYLYQVFSARGIAVAIEAPDQTFIGSPFMLSVVTKNDSRSVLSEASITLNLPPGTVIVGEASDKTVEIKELGSIGLGGINRQDFEVIVLDGENTIKNFEVALVYKPSTLTTPFEKKIVKNVAVGKPALTLEVFAPNRVFSGENFELSLNYANNADFDFENLNLKIEYPPSFTFKSATLNPDAGNNFWNLGDLKSGSEGILVIDGNIVGPDQSFFDLRSTISVSLAGKRYDIVGRNTSLSISPSPLALSIFVNDSVDYIAKPGDFLNYMITYQNNTGTGLRDVILTLRLVGEMFDFTNVNTDGFVSSLNRVVSWNAANVPELRLLPAGARGNVNVSIKATSAYPISRLNDKDFILSASAQIESSTVPALVGAERTIGVAALETKVGGRIDINAKAFFRDAASGILNSGPWPPMVDAPTQYTVHWELKNFSTDVSSVEVRAFLLGGIRWTGKVQSNIENIPEYNERTQEIIWKIPRIQATRGIIGEPIKSIFQIEATPSVGFIGRYLPLVSETRVRGIDEFTGLEITNLDFGLSTVLTDDMTVGAGQGAVRQ